jgi:hypothetical protein
VHNPVDLLCGHSWSDDAMPGVLGATGDFACFAS